MTDIIYSYMSSTPCLEHGQLFLSSNNRNTSLSSTIHTNDIIDDLLDSTENSFLNDDPDPSIHSNEPSTNQSAPSSKQNIYPLRRTQSQSNLLYLFAPSLVLSVHSPSPRKNHPSFLQWDLVLFVPVVILPLPILVSISCSFHSPSILLPSFVPQTKHNLYIKNKKENTNKTHKKVYQPSHIFFTCLSDKITWRHFIINIS